MVINEIITNSIVSPWLPAHVSLHVLRLDKVHDVVSGNKQFKLKYHLQQAQQAGKNTVATFGGAWSNHIIATAFACRQAGLKSLGFIRGERPIALSATLQDCERLGMQLIFVDRQAYREKAGIKKYYHHEDWYWVDEGGSGWLGVLGASAIADTVDFGLHTHIITAVGTGTTLAGLLLKSKPGQVVVGISSMKNNLELDTAIVGFMTGEQYAGRFDIFHNYHFGGYGKHPQELLDFINDTYINYNLPLDIIYTGKTFYAIRSLCTAGYFTEGSKILMIHTGGLQGNRSVSKGLLAF